MHIRCSMGRYCTVGQSTPQRSWLSRWGILQFQGTNPSQWLIGLSGDPWKNRLTYWFIGLSQSARFCINTGIHPSPSLSLIIFSPGKQFINHCDEGVLFQQQRRTPWRTLYFCFTPRIASGLQSQQQRTSCPTYHQGFSPRAEAHQKKSISCLTLGGWEIYWFLLNPLIGGGPQLGMSNLNQ